jgi:hypothetical protein
MSHDTRSILRRRKCLGRGRPADKACHHAGERISPKQLVTLTSGGLAVGRVFRELPAVGQLLGRGRWRVVSVQAGDRETGQAARAEVCPVDR